MISDFLCLDYIKRTDETITCSCCLPDPDLDCDEEMVICGNIQLYFSSLADENQLTITLFDNFKDLIIGDSYQRKIFIKTIIALFNMQFSIYCDDATIILHDPWGDYSGKLDFVDEIIRR